MNSVTYILRDLNILVCECGILLQLDRLKENQYNSNKKNQWYDCPVCKREIKELNQY